MPGLNGSEFVGSPLDTLLSPFTDLLGSGFILVPFTVIAIALYVRTQDLMVTGLFMLGVGALFTGTNAWIGYSELGFLYIIFIILGFITLVMGILMPQRRL